VCLLALNHLWKLILLYDVRQRRKLHFTEHVFYQFLAGVLTKFGLVLRPNYLRMAKTLLTLDVTQVELPKNTKKKNHTP
jgi:hypothetical protein